jgi:hypothetical protein
LYAERLLRAAHIGKKPSKAAMRNLPLSVFYVQTVYFANGRERTGHSDPELVFANTRVPNGVLSYEARRNDYPALAPAGTIGAAADVDQGAA